MKTQNVILLLVIIVVLAAFRQTALTESEKAAIVDRFLLDEAEKLANTGKCNSYREALVVMNVRAMIRDRYKESIRTYSNAQFITELQRVINACPSPVRTNGAMLQVFPGETKTIMFHTKGKRVAVPLEDYLLNTSSDSQMKKLLQQGSPALIEQVKSSELKYSAVVDDLNAMLKSKDKPDSISITMQVMLDTLWLKQIIKQDSLVPGQN